MFKWQRECEAAVRARAGLARVSTLVRVIEVCGGMNLISSAVKWYVKTGDILYGTKQQVRGGCHGNHSLTFVLSTCISLSSLACPIDVLYIST